MAQVPLAPPPPSKDPIMDRWFYLLWKRISSAGQILWSYLDFTGSNLTDLATRNHADLQNVNSSSYTHLTSTQATDLTDAGDSALHYHATDRARANHTGTQTASTVSDFNASAVAAMGEVTYEVTGFKNSTTHAPQLTSITFTDATRTLSIAPTGASFDFWINGVKFTKSVAQTVVISDVDGDHFVYFDNTGTLQHSVTPWNLLQHACVCYIYWNVTLAKGIPFEERHGNTMDGATHSYLHSTRGTQYVSGLAIGDYTVNLATNAGIQLSISTGIISDEDLRSTLTAVSPGSYMVAKRAGASGVWTWTTGNTVPFPVTATEFGINQFSGGVWTDVALSSNNFCNIYIVATPSITAGYQLMMIPGQVEHTTLASAQSEIFSSLSLGGLPFQENVVIYQVTFQRGAAYASTGKVRIAATPVILRGNTTVLAVGINVHNNLSGLQGGAASDYYHLTSAQATDLTDGGETTLHTHAAAGADMANIYAFAAAQG